LSSQLFYLLDAAFCLLVVSALMDKDVFSLAHSRLFEELLEANAYLLLIVPLMLSPVRAFQRLPSFPAVAESESERQT
jgi:hypothetical protein